MTREFLTRTFLAAAAMAAIPAMMAGCSKGSDETPPPPPPAKTMSAVPATMGNTPVPNPAMPTPAMPAPVPGGLATGDAAAQGMIEQARNLMKTDKPKAESILEQLKAKNMYDSLSPTEKANVDQLEKDIDAAK